MPLRCAERRCPGPDACPGHGPALLLERQGALREGAGDRHEAGFDLGDSSRQLRAGVRMGQDRLACHWLSTNQTDIPCIILHSSRKTRQERSMHAHASTIPLIAPVKSIRASATTLPRLASPQQHRGSHHRMGTVIVDSPSPPTPP